MTSRLVTFRLEDRWYALDVSAVQEVLRGLPLTRVPLAPPAVAGLINLRGQVVTAVDLRRRLGLGPRGEDHEQMLVVLRRAGDQVALLVDGIGSVVPAEPDRFEPPPGTAAAADRGLVLGVYQQPDHLLLLLDVDRAVAA
ncbi:MAG: chemotaxis protein CheW [Nocardioidaceae bacterium]